MLRATACMSFRNARAAFASCNHAGKSALTFAVFTLATVAPLVIASLATATSAADIKRHHCTAVRPAHRQHRLRIEIKVRLLHDHFHVLDRSLWTVTSRLHLD